MIFHGIPHPEKCAMIQSNTNIIVILLIFFILLYFKRYAKMKQEVWGFRPSPLLSAKT